MRTTNRSLERSVLIAAPLPRVWDAIADPEQMGRWFLPAVLGATMLRVDDRLSVNIGGFMTAELAIVDALEAPHRMVIRGLPDALLAIAWSLEVEGEATRVTVVVSGFEALAPDAVEDRIAASGPAWERALANLSAFMAGAELPHPEGLVAALLGYRRQGVEATSVERSIWIRAARTRVWDAIADPEQLTAWFSPGTPWRRSGDQVGARLTSHDPESGAETHVEVVERIDPPGRLTTRTLEGAGGSSYVTDWVLTEDADGTRVTITHSGYVLQAAAAPGDDPEQNAFGFGMMLENLRAYVDEQELPIPGGF